MSKETSVFGIPYPEDTDAPDGPTQLKAMAEAVEAALLAAVPTGTIIMLGEEAAPTGFVLADGSAVNRSGKYEKLFERYGTKFGAGNGTTTFNLPDLRGRTPVGIDGAAGRLSANDELGKASGAETHTLTTAQIPSHAHGMNNFYTGPSEGWPSVFAGSGASLISLVNGGTQAAGGGAAHNNLQPYQIVQFAIRYL